MRFDAERHHRRNIRLKGYDYSQPGAYFITICTRERLCLFGEVVDGEMQLNEYGHIALECWKEIPLHFPQAELDAFVVMPNHVHGIIVIIDVDVGATHASPLPLSSDARPRGPQRQSVSSIVGSFKSAATKHINEYRGTPGAPVWQRNYYEHIIRNDESLHRIREYIETNPARWALDRENLYREGVDPFDEWMNSFARREDSDAR
ncbi:MAG: transposase [Candidatus Bipolaricaulota bacterium]|nr:transposase [Candidatus Bipolaricaulota bacterium]